MVSNPLVEELKKLMGPHIYINSAINTDIKSMNLYIACEEESSIIKKHCHQKKLIVPNDIIEDYYQLLAMDVKNPTKSYLLTSISAGSFDSMEFIIHENEILDIFIEN